MGRQQVDSNSSFALAACAGFAVGTALTAAAAYAISSSRQRSSTPNDTANTSSSSSYSSTTASRASRAQTTKMPSEIRSEQLSRNLLYFDEDGMKSIATARVAVIGLGGVGSHCAHLMARSGVGYLRLIDFDQVTLSSLNRHACATLEDVGIPKVAAMQRFLERICPDRRYLEIDSRIQMYTGDSAKDGNLLDGEWDLIIDAIDDVPTKANLLVHCVKKGIHVISCMGAGGKSDFTRLHVSDLRSATRDPLATKLRTCLKRRLKNDKIIKDESYLDDTDKISIIYSSEKTVVKLADFTEKQKDEGIHKFGAVDNMRIRVLPVLGTMPAIMGQSLAALALCELGKKPFSPFAGERLGKNVRNRLLQHCKRREKKFRDTLEGPAQEADTESATDNTNDNGKKRKQINPNDDWRPACVIDNKWVGPAQVDLDDVEYLMAEVWRNRCAVNGDRLGTVLELVRWDLSKPSNPSNLVLMGTKALQDFDKAYEKSGDGRDSIAPAVREKVEARLATAKVDCF
mmetsp:Transcript_26344/g.57782  ORF Transcript_26344/g.57782 Transcript_26344/m.57782 type:complete len:515 (+) Transcript_26344:85-1629(+)